MFASLFKKKRSFYGPRVRSGKRISKQGSTIRKNTHIFDLNTQNTHAD